MYLFRNTEKKTVQIWSKSETRMVVQGKQSIFFLFGYSLTMRLCEIRLAPRSMFEKMRYGLGESGFSL